jgi:hypothetical protein
LTLPTAAATTTTSPDPCVLCRARPGGSEDHVISKWVSRMLWKVSPLTPAHGALPPRGPDGGRPRVRRIIDLTSTALCTECNTRWLSNLDNRSKPLLEPAIAGQPFQIDSASAVQIAAWCYVKGLQAELALRESAGEPRASWPAGLLRELGDFYWHRRPPVGAAVWLGRYDLADSWPELVSRVDSGELGARRRGVEYTGWHVLFTIGNLLAITVRWDAQPPDHFELRNSPVPPGALIRIWPVQSGYADWPPPAISYATLCALANWSN